MFKLTSDWLFIPPGTRLSESLLKKCFTWHFAKMSFLITLPWYLRIKKGNTCHMCVTTAGFTDIEHPGLQPYAASRSVFWSNPHVLFFWHAPLQKCHIWKSQFPITFHIFTCELTFLRCANRIMSNVDWAFFTNQGQFSYVNYIQSCVKSSGKQNMAPHVEI